MKMAKKGSKYASDMKYPSSAKKGAMSDAEMDKHRQRGIKQMQKQRMKGR
jgi:hypothetical protein